MTFWTKCEREGMDKEEGVAATEAQAEDRMSEHGSTYTVKLYVVNACHRCKTISMGFNVDFVWKPMPM